jgi:hypothetical protein
VRVDTYNPINAGWLAELSRLIYFQDHTERFSNGFSRNDFLSRVGLVERTFYISPTLQFALVEPIGSMDHPMAVVVFRGTTGHLANWRINFDIALSPWPTGGSVHRGFKSIILKHWDAIDKMLYDMENPVFSRAIAWGAPCRFWLHPQDRPNRSIPSAHHDAVTPHSQKRSLLYQFQRHQPE